MEKPRLLGRALRVAAGLACFYIALDVLEFEWNAAGVAALSALIFLGASFVIGGLLANPG